MKTNPVDLGALQALLKDFGYGIVSVTFKQGFIAIEAEEVARRVFPESLESSLRRVVEHFGPEELRALTEGAIRAASVDQP